jgi:hypothetical protein
MKNKSFIDDKGTRRLLIINTCAKCQTEFHPTHIRQIYCGNSCSNSAVVRRKKLISICTHDGCENECEYWRNKFCRECINLRRHQGRCIDGVPLADCTLDQATLKRRGGANAYDNIRAHARKVIMKDRIDSGEGCEQCGWSHHVHVCHVKPIKDYPLDTLISEINNPSNLKLLCPNCHWLFDH